MNLLLHCTCVLPGKFLNGSFNHTEYDFAHGVVITVNSGMKPFLCKWWNDHFKNIENMNNKSVFKNKEKNKPYYRKQHSPVHIEVVQTKPQGRYCTHSHNTILNIVFLLNPSAFISSRPEWGLTQQPSDPEAKIIQSTHRIFYSVVFLVSDCPTEAIGRDHKDLLILSLPLWN